MMKVGRKQAGERMLWTFCAIIVLWMFITFLFHYFGCE